MKLVVDKIEAMVTYVEPCQSRRVRLELRHLNGNEPFSKSFTLLSSQIFQANIKQCIQLANMDMLLHACTILMQQNDKNTNFSMGCASNHASII